MPTTNITFNGTKDLRDSTGNIVGSTDKVYEPKPPRFTIAEILVKGDLSGPLQYNGVRLKVLRVNTVIGLEISMGGPRGPVWKDVECEVLN